MTSTFAFLPNIGPLEVGIVLLIVLIIFGPKRIPAAFRSLGEALRGLRDTVGGGNEDGKEPTALSESSRDEGNPSGSGVKEADPDQAAGTGEKTGTKTET